MSWVNRHFVGRHAFLVLTVLTCKAIADAPPAGEVRSWELCAGVMPSYLPDFKGSRTASLRVLPWVSGSYGTEDWGTFGLDSGAFTVPDAVYWDFLDRDEAGLGILLGERVGRSESDPSLLTLEDGSTRLRGLGSIDGGLDYGVQGHVMVLGLPLFAQVRRTFEGASDLQVIVGAYAPIKRGERLTVILLPTVVWVDEDEAQTYFGVTQEQSARSGIPAFDAGAGWQCAAFEAMVDVQISGGWYATADLAYLRLLDDAADSPIVERVDQFSAGLGLTYHF
jgi:outer membrane scaffolding protein for murein synthesis (MipA/OmpV family)